MTIQIEHDTVHRFDELEREWRELEAIARPSFFQTWTWVGCLAEERYPDPVLLRATSDGRTVGLALFNRRGGRLYLSESGDPIHDAPFIEHNGPLIASGHESVGPDLLQHAWRLRGVRRLILNGVPGDIAAAAGGIAWRVQERAVPVVDLDEVRAAGCEFLATRSANTRHQIRRSNRFYEARGALSMVRAATRSDALELLDTLIDLHTATWQRRGKPGAFAESFVQRFHRTLICRAHDRGELDLCLVSAGANTVGILYNVWFRERVYAYQSGFAYPAKGSHGRPGLTCHATAIEMAKIKGVRVYDFLAGAHRYKSSLSNSIEMLFWTELVQKRSVPGIFVKLFDRL